MQITELIEEAKAKDPKFKSKMDYWTSERTHKKKITVLRGSSGSGKSYLACIHAANEYLKGVTFILDLNEWRGSLPTPEEMVKTMGEWQDGMKVPTAMANVYACGGTIDLQFWPEYLAGQGMLSGGSV